MTASYEKLIEELYKSDKSKLEATLESDAKEILNDPAMRKLLKDFIVRLDRESNIVPNSLKAINYYELLASVKNLEDFTREQEELKRYCAKESDLGKVVDDSSLNRFLRLQKMKNVRKVDESYEYEKFKEYLKKKYQSKNFR